jgi:hypothetical protein
MIARWEAAPCECYDCHGIRAAFHDAEFNGPELRAAEEFERDNPQEY